MDKRTKEYRDEVKVKDFDHCPKCGVELLEDEKSAKCEAHCNKCIWKDA